LSHEIKTDEMVTRTVRGTPLVLTRIEGEVFAFFRYCPHASGDLSKGKARRGRVDCPDHAYRFDICSGRVLWPEDEVYRLKRYAVREINGKVLVRVE
jgi:nitrite reductase/ring-hydroxylating ferredoxin subunit